MAPATPMNQPCNACSRRCRKRNCGAAKAWKWLIWPAIWVWPNINGALGQRNFNSYLNQFRIQAACEQLADPARRRLPVLSIALDVGFASIGPFNRAFKVQLGMTPSEYRRQKLGEN